MDRHHYICELLEKYLSNTCTPAESATFVRMFQSAEDKIYLEQLIEQYLKNDDSLPVDQAALDRVFSKLDLGQQPKINTGKGSFFFVKIAAAILLAISALITVWLHQHNRVTHQQETTIVHDIAPGGNRATLTLEDGQEIDLSTEQNGILVKEDQIAYASGDVVAASTMKYPTLRTPKGGQYHITLADGTKVWLNASSSLRYPLQFSGQQRVVELEGEGYFEVSKQKKPFKVVSNGQTVEVLGTAFNVFAYTEEHATKTTLVEGSVRVTPATHHPASRQAGDLPITIKPGQQSTVSKQGIDVAPVDVEAAIDWKNGDFTFNNEDLKSIMRKIARWYAVDVVYEDKLSNDAYSAQISRDKNLSEVLRILELSGSLKSRIANHTLFLSSPNTVKN